MSDNSWDNLNINIGYAGMYQDQPSDDSDSSASDTSDTNFYLPSNYTADSTDRPSASGIIQTRIKSSKPGAFRMFCSNVTFYILLFSGLSFCCFFFLAGIFSGIEQHFHTMQRTASFCRYGLGYSFLACFFFAFTYACVDPDA